MAYETIVYEKTGPVVTLTLNRPDTINAINPQMTAEIHGALDEADADAEVRAIILTGAGRGFSAGFDIARRPDGRSSLDATGVEVAEYIKRWWGRDRDSAMELMHLWHLTKPVIAAVHGWVMGGGFWYALASDITIAADNSVFAQPEVRHVSNTTFLFAALAGWKAAHVTRSPATTSTPPRPSAWASSTKSCRRPSSCPAREPWPNESPRCPSPRCGSTRRSPAMGCSPWGWAPGC
jgi:enoyl-CoA hydratase/carnithine racemase